MILSILICTIPERREKFISLTSELCRQIKDHSIVQFEYDDTPRGIITIGAKRQSLLERAKGDYICFIDDDDTISDDYIESIIEAAKLNPNCIGFKIKCDMDGKPADAISSLKYKDWVDNKDGFRYVRSIYHKTPVRREIALKVGFPDKSYGEDYVYSMGLQPHLKSEQFIDKFLYHYNYKHEDPKIKYGLK